MENLFSYILSGISYIGPFIILMGTLIFIHELGHFLVAKYFGVRVEVFSLGFGKSLYEFTRGDTTYKLAMIPLGGYVKMFGDDPEGDISPEEQKYSFLHKPVWQRIWIVLAGPLMNFFIAIPIFALILILGYRAPANIVGDIKENTEAHLIGFRSGDQITHINEKVTPSWTNIEKQINQNFLKDLSFTVKNSKGETNTFKVNIPRVKNERLFGTQEYMGKIDGLSVLSKQALIGVKVNSIAQKSGLKSLDQILSINDDEVSHWRDIEPLLVKHQNSTINLVVRQFSQTEDLPKRNVTLKSSYGINGESFLNSVGIEKTESYILGIVKGSPAEKAGLKPGDKIISINDNKILAWTDILNNIKSFKPENKFLKLEVENSDPQYGRNDSSKAIQLTPELTQHMNRKMQDENRFTVGIYSDSTFTTAPPVRIQSSNPIKALKYGFFETLHWTKLITVSIYKLVTNQVSTRNITGIITIGKVAGDSFKSGIDLFLKMMGLISVNLFLLNLLPIPVLDGGHLVFFTIEAIKGSPLSVKKMQAAQQFGLILLLSLMVFSFYNDIKNLIDPIW